MPPLPARLPTLNSTSCGLLLRHAVATGWVWVLQAFDLLQELKGSDLVERVLNQLLRRRDDQPASPMAMAQVGARPRCVGSIPVRPWWFARLLL